MLPNFFVVGAQKAATTSLHYYLAGHPDIYLPEQKETHFFVRDELFNMGLEYYEKTFFSNHGSEKAVGEVDPEYMYFSQALERIKTGLDIKNIKFIFIFRNPVERAFSQYQMSFRRAIEPLSFEEAIEVETERLSKGYYEKEHFSYLSRGDYYHQILPFIESTDKSNLLFLLAEDLKDNRDATLRKVFEFLGVNINYVPEDMNKDFHRATVPKNMAITSLIRGKGSYTLSAFRCIAKILLPKLALRNKLKEFLLALNSKPSDLVIDNKTRERLVKYYRSKNEKLSAVIARDISHWN